MVCLVCFRKDTSTTPVEAQIGASETFGDLLDKFSSFDTTGKRICPRCIANLIIAHNFTTDFRKATKKHKLDTINRTCTTCHTTFHSSKEFLLHSKAHPIELNEDDSDGDEDEDVNGKEKGGDDTSQRVSAIKQEQRMDDGEAESLEDRTLRIVNAINASANKCGECYRTFSDKSQLNRHLRRHAEKADQVECGKCGLRFLLQTHMNEHRCVRRHILGVKRTKSQF